MINKSIKESQCVPIVGDGAIATGRAANGRAIPVLILNCENHKDLLNLIYLHENSPPGDVVCTWGKKVFNSKYAFLLLEFSRPSVIEIAIKFDLFTQYVLADGVVQARGVYLQPQESGHRVLDGLDKPKILIEVSPKTKLQNWDNILLKAIHNKIKHSGMSKKEADIAAKEILDRTREIWGLKMDFE